MDAFTSAKYKTTTLEFAEVHIRKQLFLLFDDQRDLIAWDCVTSQGIQSIYKVDGKIINACNAEGCH